MRLAKLKLAGFKSFVDPTVILTPGQLVGIVGPNGCGKSNVIDAVRWVLGETRASALRGESMQDVIFNGSTTRKPVSRASVEMIFDNAEGRTAGQWSQYAEISVRRQVDRNGGSDYFINNVSVRRKDVIDLFLGTGLGPRAYAIIEQGMISRVIEARPEEVRAFLEEAAGITKYKERRRETEGRLGDANENLARVEDIRAELGQQLEKLAVQAEAARRYKELSSQLSQRQILLWRVKHHFAVAEATRAAGLIAQTQTTLEEGQARLTETETGLTLAREAQLVSGDALSGAQALVFEATAELNRIEAELKHMHDAHARLHQRGEQILGEEERWSARREQAELETLRWSEQGEQLAEALEMALLQVEEAEARLPEAEEHWQGARGALEAARAASAQQEQAWKVEEARAQAARRALEALAARRVRLEAERRTLQPEDEAALNELELQLAELVERQQHAALTHEAALEAQEQARDAEQQAQAGQSAAARRLTELRARLDALRGLQARLAPAGDLASWLRQAGLEGEAPLWAQVQVEEGWELALEAVLRERLHARRLPAAGEAQALAQAAPQSLVLLREAAAPAPRAPLFEAPLLIEKLRCENPRLRAQLAHWLDGVYAVEALGAHLAQSLPAGVALVARSGELLSASSLVLFAPEAQTHGALERQRELEVLENELPPLAAAQEAARQALLAAQEAQRSTRERVQGAQREAQRLQAEVHARQLAFVKAQQEQARQVERVEQLAREAAELQRLEGVESAHVREAEAACEAAHEALPALQAAQDEAQVRAEAAEAALRRVREARAATQQARHAAEFAVREANARHEESARQTQLAAAELEKLARERAALEQEQGGLDDAALRVALQTARDLRATREASLVQCRAALDAANARLRELDETRLRAEHALGPLREALAEARLALQAAELARDQAAERLGELGAEIVPLEAAVLDEVREATLAREVARLTREIAQMGEVNLAALTELESARERKHYLDVQFDDLTRAISTLEDAIRRIDRETREQLQATYTTVNRHFGELFPRLFGGGQAQLVLTGEDLLDAGVQIIAQPPGKKNSSIHLLSGGEKALTAIALVFAMFQLNPAPFCMLDEVDAPLDDRNTERYCEMVRHMSSVTQFIFISHSKITMERAQQLVGVTMQEQGVSRVVEVDMDQALKLAQPAPA